MALQGGKLVTELVERGMVVMMVSITIAADPLENKIRLTHSFRLMQAPARHAKKVFSRCAITVSSME